MYTNSKGHGLHSSPKPLFRLLKFRETVSGLIFVIIENGTIVLQTPHTEAPDILAIRLLFAYAHLQHGIRKL
jgi:hypothetical protein